MKKFISLVSIALLVFSISISNAFATPSANQVKSFAILEFKIKQVKNGELYIKAFDVFAKNNWNNRTYLGDIKTKLEKLLVSGAIKNNSDLTVLGYLNAKIGLVLKYDLAPGYSSSSTSSSNNNTSSSGSVSNTSTGSTISTSTGTFNFAFEKPTGNILSKEQYSAMSEYNYTLGTNNASFSIFEYSDLKSSASAKLHNDDIIINMLSQYGVLTDYHLLHFPNGDDSQMVAEVAECLAYQKGGSVFYDFVNGVFRDQRFDKDYVLSKAEGLGANRTTLTECLNIGFFREKVQKQKALGEYLFSITEIPTVVIRNNNSGRFVILKGQHSLLDYQNAFEGLYK